MDNNLNIEFTYDPEFSNLLTTLHLKYGEDIFALEGIGEQKLDINQASQEYFRSSNTVDVTVDENANVDDNTVLGYTIEIPKPFFRLNSIYKMWETTRRLFGKEKADQVIEAQISGDIYTHDLTGYAIRSYCWAASMMDIAILGLPFINRTISKPAQHLDSFISHINQTVMFMSNQIDGAVALPDLFVTLAYFIRKDIKEGRIPDPEKEPKKYRQHLKQQFQIMIYTLNQPVRAGQSPYTNISIFDRPFMEKLFQDIVYPDGSKPDFDFIDEIQFIYAEFYNEELENQILTFPVPTAAITIETDENGNRKPLDPDFIDKIAKLNTKFAQYNIYTGEATALSSCCFRGDQTCVTKSSNGVNFMTFEELANSNYKNHKRNFTILHNGSWVKGKLVTTTYNRTLYSVKTSNNKEIIVTDDHIHATLEGDKKTSELSTNDYLLFNINELNTFPEKDQNLTYEQGFMIGLFLGDGSFGTRYKGPNGKELSRETNFSLNENCYSKCMEILDIAAKDIGSNNTTTLSKPYNNVYPVRISGSEISGFIKNWTTGTRAWLKSLNPDVLLQNKRFRRGILDGLYESDGGNSNRIYTTSMKLAEDIELLCTSLGINTIINISDRTNEKVIIRGETYNRNYPLYCIRFYGSGNKRSMRDVYIYRNNSVYFKITDIQEVKPESTVYDFEMDNQNEPYFTLPNGIITHNCRLRNDMSNENMTLSLDKQEETSAIANEYINSFGATSALKIGSHRVCTIDLPRVSLKSSNQREFIEELDKALLKAYMVLKAHRFIVRDITNSGKLPLYRHGLMDLNRQYSTFGIIGIPEMCELMGLDAISEEGLEFQERVINHINNFAKSKNKVEEEESYIVEFRDGHKIQKVINSKVSILRKGQRQLVNVKDLKWNDHYNGRTVKKVYIKANKISYTYNVEQIPGESAAVKMLKKDKLIFKSPELDNYHLYSNQFVPLDKDISIAKRMKIHGRFDHKIGGGAILHINVAERVEDPNIMKKLILKAIEANNIYFAINYNFQECPDGHITVGRVNICPTCGKPIVQEYSRVVGFITPKSNWSKQRRGEDRIWLETP
jgi:anaerobic ribonucleoside-triphosphate reductase